MSTTAFNGNFTVVTFLILKSMRFLSLNSKITELLYGFGLPVWKFNLETGNFFEMLPLRIIMF